MIILFQIVINIFVERENDEAAIASRTGDDDKDHLVSYSSTPPPS